MEQKLDEITIHGVRYVSLRRAADLTGYAADYVGQLARAGRVLATRVGRNWYVEEVGIIEHRNSREEAADAQPRVSEISRRTSIFKGSYLIYEKDDGPLIPPIQKKTKQAVHIPITPDDSVQEVPNSIFTRANEALEQVVRTLSLPKRMATVAFAAFVFVGVFTLNGSYTVNLIKDGATAMTSAVAESEFTHTVGEDILAPYKRSAMEFNRMVDEAVYTVFQTALEQNQ